MISETRRRFSRTLHTSAKKRISYFVGAFMRFSPCGADGWDNTERSWKLNYKTPRDASGRTSDAEDAPRNSRNRRTTRTRTAFSRHLNYFRIRRQSPAIGVKREWSLQPRDLRSPLTGISCLGFSQGYRALPHSYARSYSLEIARRLPVSRCHATRSAGSCLTLQVFGAPFRRSALKAIDASNQAGRRRESNKRSAGSLFERCDRDRSHFVLGTFRLRIQVGAGQKIRVRLREMKRQEERAG